MDLLIEIRHQLEIKLKTLNITDTEFIQLYTEDMEKAQRKVRQTLMQKVINQSLRQGTAGGTMQEIYNLTASAAPQKNDKGYFITINYDDKKIDPAMIPKYMEQTLKKKWIVDCEYVIEQRNETVDNYAGFHVHMLLTGHQPKKKVEVIREIYSTNKKLVGSIQSIDCKPVNTVDGIHNYMAGQKKDAWKKTKSENDLCMRKHYGFQQIYSVKFDKGNK